MTIERDVDQRVAYSSVFTSESIASDGAVAFVDIELEDGSFEWFGKVPPHIKIAQYGNRGPLSYSDTYSKGMVFSGQFLAYDPSKVDMYTESVLKDDRGEIEKLFEKTLELVRDGWQYHSGAMRKPQGWGMPTLKTVEMVAYRAKDYKGLHPAFTSYNFNREGFCLVDDYISGDDKLENYGKLNAGLKTVSISKYANGYGTCLVYDPERVNIESWTFREAENPGEFDRKKSELERAIGQEIFCGRNYQTEETILVVKRLKK